MNQAQLLVVLHAHQPVGRTDDAVIAAHAERYRPLLDALLAAEPVRLTLHVSGALLEWLTGDAPESAEILRRLVTRGQIELLGGGAYEPLLPFLPDWDAQNQLQRMQELVQAAGGVAATGAWLAEGVFEPDLPRLLGPAGLHHTVITTADDRRVLGYAVAERAGHPLALFSTDAVATRLLREGRRDELRADLAALADSAAASSGRGVCGAIDIDRLEPTALAGLVEGLAGLGPAVELVTLADYRSRFPARSLAHPGSLGPEALRGGAHLAMQPAARSLHTRMLHASKKVLEAETELGVGAGALGESRRALLRGQGQVDLLDSRLRHAAYAHLIESENLVDAEQRGEGDFIEYEEDDFDADLRDEAVLANAQLVAWVDPDEGGALTELDDRGHALAQVQVLASGEAGAGLAHRSFVDRFPAAAETLEQAAAGVRTELGEFAAGRYVVEASGVDEEGDLSASITLVCEAHVRTEDGPRPLLIEKTYHVPVDAPRLEVEYVFENPGDAPLQLLFAPELCLSPFGGEGEACGFDLAEGQRASLGSSVNLGQRTALVLRDTEAGVRLSLGADHETEMWAYPLRRAGVYQGTCVSLRQSIALAPRESHRLRFTIQITDLE